MGLHFTSGFPIGDEYLRRVAQAYSDGPRNATEIETSLDGERR